jgi:hypothetical protein
MQKLWRKTADLFFRHPALWLPYLGAHYLAAGLTSLRRVASERILEWCPTSHSVLGARFQNCGSQSWGTKLTLIRLLRAGSEYVNHCVFTIELILIAAIACAILRGQKPTIANIKGTSGPSLSRILFYTLEIWFLILVLEVLIFEPAYLDALSAHVQAGWVLYGFETGQAMLNLICYTWIMVPLAIALLRPVGSNTVSIEEKRQGRNFLILAGVATYAMQSLLIRVVALFSIFHSNTVRSITLSILSPVFSFPGLLGDIALVLLASREDWRSAESKPILDTQKLLRGLMPLHYSHRDEEP